MNTFIRKLLDRGAAISIERGQLMVRTPQGELVSADWMERHSKALVREILTALGREAYVYDSYTTGWYGARRASGVTVQFESFTTEAYCYVNFNAELTRARDTKAGNKGTRLPDGHFRISKRSRLYSLWKSTGLKLPRRLAALHDYMGNLRVTLFTASLSARHPDRLEKHSIRPLEISATEIHQAFCPDRCRTCTGQSPDNIRTNPPDKEAGAAQQNRPLQPDATACTAAHGKTVIGTNEHTATIPYSRSLKRPEEQSTEEWLADYCGEGCPGVIGCPPSP